MDKEYEIKNRRRKRNGGKIPSNIQQKVNNELQGYVTNKMEKMKEKFATLTKNKVKLGNGFELMVEKDGEPLSVIRK